jgi:hypothetical protein
MKGLMRSAEEPRFDVAHFIATVRGAILVPAGLVARRCYGRNCHDWIYDVPNPSQPGKTRPVYVGPYRAKSGLIEGIHPTRLLDGCGIDHHANCPDAKSFISRRK